MYFCSQELTLFREGYQILSSKIWDKITGEKKPAKILADAFSNCEFTNCLWKQFFLTNVHPKKQLLFTNHYFKKITWMYVQSHW